MRLTIYTSVAQRRLHLWLGFYLQSRIIGGATRTPQPAPMLFEQTSEVRLTGVEQDV